MFVHSGCVNWQPRVTMKMKNKRILALLSTTAFVVVAGTMSSKADETSDKQAYLDGTRRELVGGYQMPPDVTGVTCSQYDLCPAVISGIYG